MKIKFILSFFVSIFSVVVATSSGSATYMGCKLFLTYFKWQCSDEFRQMGPGYTSKMSSGKISKVVSACNCNSPQFMASFADCITRASLNQDDLYRAMKVMPKKCKKYNPDLTIHSINKMFDNATDNNYFVKIESLGEVAQAKKIINYNPIRFSDQIIVKVRRSYSSGYYVKYTGLLYG